MHFNKASNGKLRKEEKCSKKFYFSFNEEFRKENPKDKGKKKKEESLRVSGCGYTPLLTD